VPTLDGTALVLDQVEPPEERPIRLGTGCAINLTPWFHAMGTIAGLNAPLLTGTTLVLHDRLDPAAYLADAERFRVTMLGGAPPLFGALLRHPDLATRDLSSVRSITSGAAPMPVEMIEGLRRRFGNEVVIAEGYGLTEVTMVATMGPQARSGVHKPGTVGLPVYDTEVRVVDPAGGDLTPLPVGEPGEVCIRGPQVMVGYKDRPEDTATALVDGWLPPTFGCARCTWWTRSRSRPRGRYSSARCANVWWHSTCMVNDRRMGSDSTGMVAPAAFPTSRATRRRRAARVRAGIALVGYAGSFVTLAAMLVLAATAGALADGVPAGGATVTATYER
jgi:acyl-CoA synthetase (AMP-forming)/AMP-acid ligase II